jgi:hypothetical protein
MSYWFLDGGGAWRYVIPHLQEGDTVIGSNPNINKFFREILGVKTIDLKTPPSLYPFFLSNIIRAKLEYRKHFKHIKNDKFCLFGGITTITWFSYFKKLSKNNEISLVVPDDKSFKFFRQTEAKTLYRYPMKLIGRLMGLNIGVMDQLGRPNWYLKEAEIPNLILTKYKKIEPKIDLPDEYLKKNYILLLNDLGTLAADAKAVSDKVAELLDPSKTIIKNHTRDPEVFGKLKDFDFLPPFIPAELIINAKEWDAIICVWVSKVLLYKTNIKKVSLYHLFNWTHPVNDEWLGWCKDEHVHMPKTEEKVLEVLNGK